MHFLVYFVIFSFICLFSFIFQVKVVIQVSRGLFPSLALIRMSNVLHLKLKHGEVQVPKVLELCIQAVGA